MGIQLSNRMKTFLAGVMVFGMACGASAAVVAYWPFGTNGLTDASGNGRTLAKSAAGVILTNGVVRLDGSLTQFSTVSTLNLSSYTALTVEFWMKTTNSANTGILIEHSNTSGKFTAYMDSGANAGQVTAGFLATAGNNLDITAVGAANDGQWHHCAIVYNKLQTGLNRSIFYFDGVYQPQFDNHISNGAASLLNATLFIGSRNNSEYKFVGELDDIRISNAALAPSQFLQVSPGADPRTIAYWPFTQGSEVVDVSGKGNVLQTWAANEVAFRDGSAIFQGHSGLFTPAALNLSSYSAVTFECFVKKEAGNPDPLLAELSVNVNTVAGAFAVSAGMMTPNAMGAGYKTATGYNVELAATNAIEDGQWHHIAYVMDLGAPGATDRTQLYLDGIRQNKAVGFDSAETTPFVGNQSFFLGWRAISPDLNFIGKMDDVRITGAALATNEFLTARTVTITTNAVVAYWPFDVADGTADASGNGHMLTGSGVAYNNGEAVFGGSQTLSTAAPLDLSSHSAYTVEYFLKTTDQNLNMILEHSPNAGSNPGAFISYIGEGAAGRLLGMLSTPTGANGKATAAGAATDGNWHHVAMVVDRSKPGAERTQLYFDYLSQPVYSGLVDNSDVLFANATVFFGSRNNSSMQFVGSLDDVKITGKALSVAEFQTRPTTALPPVVAYWPFAPGRELADASGNGYALTNSGVAFNTLAECAVFSGTQGGLGTAAALNLSWYDALTIECFAKSVTPGLAILVENTKTNSLLNQGAFYLASVSVAESGFTTAVYPYAYGGGSRYGYRFNVDQSATAVADNDWHHLALVIDPAQSGADRARLYLDGVPQTVATANTSDLVTRFLNAPIMIGSRAGSTLKFTGELDDVKITGAALTPAEFLQSRSRPMGMIIYVR